MKTYKQQRGPTTMYTNLASEIRSDPKTDRKRKKDKQRLSGKYLSMACRIARFLTSRGIPTPHDKGLEFIALGILQYQRLPIVHLSKMGARSIIIAFGEELDVNSEAFRKAYPKKPRHEMDDARFTREYRRYLNSGEWKTLRMNLIIQRGSKCERCGKYGPVDGHHLTYERLGHELPEDVLLVCRPCHEAEHGRKIA